MLFKIQKKNTKYKYCEMLRISEIEQEKRRFKTSVHKTKKYNSKKTKTRHNEQ